MMPTKYNAEIYTMNETYTLRGATLSEVQQAVHETLATGEKVSVAVRPAPPALEEYLTYGWPVWCVKVPSGQEHTFVHEGKAKHFAKCNEGTKPIKVLRLGNTFRKMTAWGGSTNWEIKDFRQAYPNILPKPTKGASEEEE
jgi:hypothetical protein